MGAIQFFQQSHLLEEVVLVEVAQTHPVVLLVALVVEVMNITMHKVEQEQLVKVLVEIEVETRVEVEVVLLNLVELTQMVQVEMDLPHQ
jgi:hypothetical protein